MRSAENGPGGGASEDSIILRVHASSGIAASIISRLAVSKSGQVIVAKQIVVLHSTRESVAEMRLEAIRSLRRPKAALNLASC